MFLVQYFHKSTFRKYDPMSMVGFRGSWLSLGVFRRPLISAPLDRSAYPHPYATTCSVCLLVRVDVPECPEVSLDAATYL
eukprot:6469993-Pyramimonas_sp.AAC.1